MQELEGLDHLEAGEHTVVRFQHADHDRVAVDFEAQEITDIAVAGRALYLLLK